MYIIGKEGEEDKLHIPIVTSVEAPKKPLWEAYGGIFLILTLIFIGLTMLSWIRNSSLKKKNEEKIRSVENYLNTSKGRKLDDLIIGEIRRRMR